MTGAPQNLVRRTMLRALGNTLMIEVLPIRHVLLICFPLVGDRGQGSRAIFVDVNDLVVLETMRVNPGDMTSTASH